MRILLDESLPQWLAEALRADGLVVDTVVEMGWSGLITDELLLRAGRTGHTLLTVDRHLSYQANMTEVRAGVVVLVSTSILPQGLKPQLGPLKRVLKQERPGQVVYVGGQVTKPSTGLPEQNSGAAAPIWSGEGLRRRMQRLGKRLGRLGQGGISGLLLLTLALQLSGCAVAPPRNIENACHLFDEKDGWYAVMRDASRKWKVPIHVQLAIMHQESKFTHDAKPPRRGTLFWFLPGPRISTAYGYAQALDGTWNWYKKKTGNWGADRDDFEDAVDFIGWYLDLSHRTLGISKWDAEKQYLAYHEGQGGYKRKSYLKKKWLMEVARKVKRLASRYRAQLKRCRDRLERDTQSGWFF